MIDHKVCAQIIALGFNSTNGSGRFKDKPSKDAYCRGIKFCKKCSYNIKTINLRCKCCGNLFRTRHKQKKGNPYHICHLREY